jgi:hypothetical protein
LKIDAFRTYSLIHREAIEVDIILQEMDKFATICNILDEAVLLVEIGANGIKHKTVPKGQHLILKLNKANLRGVVENDYFVAQVDINVVDVHHPMHVGLVCLGEDHKGLLP